MGTFVVLAALALLVTVIVRYMRRERAAGRTSCGCGCENCAMHGKCHSGK